MDTEEISHLARLLESYKRRLRVREQQAATFGNSTPPEILIEIEDIRERIADIDKLLGRDRLLGAPAEEVAPMMRARTMRSPLWWPFTLIANILKVLSFSIFTAVEYAITNRIFIGFVGISLLLSFIGIQVLAFFLPVPVRYVMNASNIPATPYSGSNVALILLPIVVSFISGIFAARSQRLWHALSFIVAGIALVLVTFVLTWYTPSAEAAETAMPSTQTIFPYRAHLSMDGPSSIRMWSSAPIILTVSVITNTRAIIDEDFGLSNVGPYTTTVAIQENNFRLAKDIDKIQGSQIVDIDAPARWVWALAPTDQYYDSQIVVFNTAMTDPSGRVYRPSGSTYIDVTFFGYPGWVRIAGLAFGALFTLIGIKDILLRFIPQREAKTKQVPAPELVGARIAYTSSEPTPPIAPAAMPTPQSAAPEESKSKRKRPPKI